MVLWPCVATLLLAALLLRGADAVPARLGGAKSASMFGRKEGASAPLSLMNPLAQALGGGGYAAEIDDCDPLRKTKVGDDLFCFDFMTFADAFGSRCSDWEGRDCSVAPTGYSQNEMRTVRAHCSMDL